MRTALRTGSIKTHGSLHLIRMMPDWFGICLYKAVQRDVSALMQQVAEWSLFLRSTLRIH